MHPITTSALQQKITETIPGTQLKAINQYNFNRLMTESYLLLNHTFARCTNFTENSNSKGFKL